jgi:hypothetical protein
MKQTIASLASESKRNSYYRASAPMDMVTSLGDVHGPIGSQWPLVHAMDSNHDHKMTRSTTSASLSLSSQPKMPYTHIAASVLIGYIIASNSNSKSSMDAPTPALAAAAATSSHNNEWSEEWRNGYVSVTRARQLAQRTSCTLILQPLDTLMHCIAVDVCL